MKRILSLFLAAITAILLFASCGKEKSTTLYFPSSSTAAYFDPQIADTQAERIVSENCFEGLVRLGENGDILPGIAEKTDISADGLTYTFTLRADAKWHVTKTSMKKLGDKLGENFAPSVTAHDFEFALKRVLDPSTNSTDSALFTCIENAADIADGKKSSSELGVTAVSDTVLQIKLSYADSDFLYALTRPAAMPCNEQFFNACSGRYGLALEYMLCNGPFFVYNISEDSYVLMTSNDDYYSPTDVKPDNVYLYFGCNEADAAARIKDEKYDGGFVSAQTYAKNFTNEKKFAHSVFSDTVWAYCFNCADTYMQNKLVRTAFTYAYDPSLIEADSTYFERNGRISTKYMTPSYDFEPQMNPYDEAKAMELYNRGIRELDATAQTVTVLTTEDFAPQVKLQIQKWQKALGIDVKIKTDTLENVNSSVKTGDYQIAFCPVAYNSGRVYAMLGSFTSESSSNLMNYKNEDYDLLFSSVRSAKDAAARTEVYKKLEQKLIDDCVLLPVLTQNSCLVVNADVSGVYALSQSEIYFKNATLS